MNRLLIVGSDSKWAIEPYFVKYLSIRFKVSFYNAHGIYMNFYYKSILHKLLVRLGVSGILNKVNSELLHLAKEKKVDAILIFKGIEIYPTTLKKLKEKGIKLFNYNPDHPFEFNGRGSGNKLVEQSIRYYDHHFSYSKRIANDLQVKYKSSVSWLPFAYAQSKEPSKNEDIKAVCFIGNPDLERAKLIKELLNAQVPVHVYGNNWSHFLGSNILLTTYPAIYQDEFITKAQAYRIQLNIFRPQNLGSHNMRTFEMPALACIVLAPFSEEHLSFFKHREEAFFYKNNIEMVELAKEIINLNSDDAFKIKNKAYNRCVKSSYHYKDRAVQIGEKIEQHLNL